MPQTEEEASVEAVRQLQVLVTMFAEAVILRYLNITIKKTDSDIYILRSGPVLPRSKLSSQASHDT